MKKWGVALGVLLVASQAGNLSAKTLEDVLKEKGVITEEDYKEVTKTKPINYTLGKGFTFTTPDEKFQLNFAGRMQFRYTYTDFDAKNTTNISQWDAKRIRLIAQGNAFSKDLTYKLEFDPRALASSSNAKGLIETYLNYRIIDEVQIKVGQMKTPFSRGELTSDGALQFVDRSIVVDAFKPSYDIGAMLNGKIADGLAYYYAGIYGGTGQTTTRSSDNNMFVARVMVNPLGDMAYSEADLDQSVKPLVSIGGNYFRNKLRNTFTPAAVANPATATPAVSASSALESTTLNYTAAASASSPGAGGWLGRATTNKWFTNTGNLQIDTYGADLAFKWMGMSLQGEYFLAEAKNLNGGKLLRAHGFYAQTGYMVIPKTLEVAFRYSYFDPNRDVINDNITEIIGGISYYFNKHNLKLQADVADIHDQGKGRTDDMIYRAQIQLIF